MISGTNPVYAKIADLIVEIPDAGDLVPRSKTYLVDGDTTPDIILNEDSFHPNAWNGLKWNDYIYMESGSCFYFHLLKYNGMMLHSSAVEQNGKAFLFSGNCGAGKSTHTRLWQVVFGEFAKVFNDDKPALRLIDGKWIAYGTPWCGKDGININMSAPLAGICFMKQADENRIRRLSEGEAIQKILAQTPHRFNQVKNLDLLLSLVGNLVQMIPVFELENRPVPEAAYLSFETMRHAAEELGL